MLKYLVCSLTLLFASLAVAAPSRPADQTLAILRQNIHQMRVVGLDGFASRARALDILDNMLDRGRYTGGCSFRDSSQIEDCVVSVDDYGIRGNIFRGRHSMHFALVRGQLLSNDLLYQITYN